MLNISRDVPDKAAANFLAISSRVMRFERRPDYESPVIGTNKVWDDLQLKTTSLSFLAIYEKLNDIF